MSAVARVGSSFGWLLLIVSAASRSFAAETVVPLAGDVPLDGPEHFFVPFTVPPGTVEIEIRHDDLSEQNILDWGLSDANGFRGWGGGNSEPAVVAIDAASRSYVAGPIAAGEWRVVVGKAKIVEQPARYQIEVVLRDTPTLAPQLERRPYAHAAPLEVARRWYAGDFHVHSRESGDARPPIDEIASFARGRGLDFVMLSDHNTLTQLEFLGDAQGRHPKLLLMPGMEYTTYAGHANAIGATRWVDHKLGQPGVTISAALAEFRQQGALVSINHPMLDIGNLCIGCAWKHTQEPEQIDAVEIATTGWDKAGLLFGEAAIQFWDGLCATGRHVAAIGGSDDHRAGVELGVFDSPIGDPTTLVEADALSVEQIVAGVRSGRTVVKLQGPSDPMLELTASAPLDRDTLSARSATFRARASGGQGHELRFVRDGQPLDPVPIDSDPFEHTIDAQAPPTGELRIRAEVLVAGKPRTVTSHVWLRRSPAATSAPAEPAGGCGCRLPPASPRCSFLPIGALALLLLRRKQRRTRATRAAR